MCCERMTANTERRDSNHQFEVDNGDDSFSEANTPPRGSRDPSPTTANADRTKNSLEIQGVQANCSSNRVLTWNHSKEEFHLSSQSSTDARKLVPILEGPFKKVHIYAGRILNVFRQGDFPSLSVTQDRNLGTESTFSQQTRPCSILRSAYVSHSIVEPYVVLTTGYTFSCLLRLL